DFSIFDAVRAGFEKVVFIIKKEIEKDFKETIGDRIAEKVKVEYVFQELDKLPAGYDVPDGRTKPWGTGHAIWCCKDVIDGPFAVINADDYYGSHAFKMIYDKLASTDDASKLCMVGYVVKNTLTENGHVSRGVCEVSDDMKLIKVQERTRIELHDGKVEYTEDEGKTWVGLPEDEIVSMNLWGFTTKIFESLEGRFKAFLDNEKPFNPLKCEFYLPSVVQEMLSNNEATVDVMTSMDKWFGVTYKEDKGKVVDAIKALKAEGVYTEKLWD
ncbi:MAG: nucleotidyltransferase, partial [Lachnospiraceae bacterium]|nr:nucleotidyltransferase [Lachnospiraceae bacterium]